LCRIPAWVNVPTAASASDDGAAITVPRDTAMPHLDPFLLTIAAIFVFAGFIKA
jgi:hypothetical protein